MHFSLHPCDYLKQGAVAAYWLYRELLNVNISTETMTTTTSSPPSLSSVSFCPHRRWSPCCCCFCRTWRPASCWRTPESSSDAWTRLSFAAGRCEPPAGRPGRLCWHWGRSRRRTPRSTGSHTPAPPRDPPPRPPRVDAQDQSCCLATARGRRRRPSTCWCCRSALVPCRKSGGCRCCRRWRRRLPSWCGSRPDCRLSSLK